MVQPTEHRINEAMIARWTRKLGIFTMILAVATVLLVVIGGITAWILSETDETSRLRDRALLYFGNPPVTPYPAAAPIVWGVGIAVGNFGNMPARQVSIRYACPDAPRSDNVKDPFPLAQWKTAEAGSVIGPKQQLVLQACDVPIAVIQDAQKDLRDLFAVVEVRYLDGFAPHMRVTQASRIFRFDQWGGESLGIAGPHNCSDDDCPK